MNVDLKPDGLVMSDVVDVIYMWWASFKAICQKLDDDTGVPSTDYEALCFTAIFNGFIGDSRGNTIINAVSTEPHRFFSITPEGINDEYFLECMFQAATALETLLEKLDLDSLTFTNYEATAAAGVATWCFENRDGAIIGAITGHRFCPGGVPKEWIADLLYDSVRALYLLTHDGTTSGLDGDGTVTDDDYEADCYTAVITRVIENSAGSQIGNARAF